MKKKRGFDYYLEDEILEDYKRKSIKLRLRWLYQINELRRDYPKEIIESHEKFRRGEL